MALVKFALIVAIVAISTFVSGTPVAEDALTQTLTKAWTNKSTGKSYEYLIRFQNTGFVEAFGFCNSINAQLLSFDSEEEFQFVRNSLIEFTGYYGFWTSGVDVLFQSSAGQQIWAVNGQPISASFFAPGEPNNAYENCVNLHNTANGYYLNDISCHLALPIICKYQV